MWNLSERDARAKDPAASAAHETCSRRWKHLTAEAFENYLRVTPIRSGDSVIINQELSEMDHFQ